MNIKVLDHVIITENSYYNFQSSGLLERLEASNKYVMPYELERQFHEELQEEVKRLEKESKKKIKGIVEQIARQMLQDGTPIEYIVKWTGLSEQKILLMSIEVHQPHDSYLRRMLSDMEVAKSLMKSHLPPDIVRRIDWNSVQFPGYEVQRNGNVR